MATEPKLDGLTTAQWLSLAESIAARDINQACLAQNGFPIPADVMRDLRMGAVAGANALLQEFISRGLIKDRL
jgi:hypothetical protein